MKKISLFFVLLFLVLVLFNFKGINASESSISDNVITYQLSESNIDLSIYKGFEFDFIPTAKVSYNVEITDLDGNTWTTQGNKAGVNGDKGSGVLASKANDTTPYFTNVFDDIAAGSYKIYIPFEFYTAKTEKNNKVINPVFKIKGYTDGLGIQVNDTIYELPTIISGTVKFIATTSEEASTLNSYISNLNLLSDDNKYTHIELKLTSDVLSAALTGYNELGTRKTVEFNTTNTIVKWNAATGMGQAAGFLLKMGNTGVNDVKIRFTISESGTASIAGVDAMTESYSGSFDENEYYVFVHMKNSVKPEGTEDKVYIEKRKVTIPAGYQGLLLVPFARLRFQADGYIPASTEAYYNGRLDNQLGSVRMYIDNISADNYANNSLTFYVLNAIKGLEGKGVSYKTVGATSGGSSIAVDSSRASEVDILSTAPTNVVTVNDTTQKSETISLLTPNTGDNASKLYMGQTAEITVTNLESNKNYTGVLTYTSGEEVVDISDLLVIDNSTAGTLKYSFKKILQSYGALTFTLKNKYDVTVNDGKDLIKEETVLSGGTFQISKEELEKEQYVIISVKANGSLVNLTDGNYVVSNINENVVIEVTYQEIKINVTKEGNGSYVLDASNVKEDGSFTITATPDDYNKIKSFKIDSEETALIDNVYSGTYNNTDINVNIEFEPITYTISVENNDNVSTTLDKKSVTYYDNATLTVLANEGYKIDKILVNNAEVSLEDGLYEFTNVTEDKEVKVEASVIIYTIKVNITGNGTYELDRTTVDVVNNSYLLTLLPNPNNIVKSVVVNEMDVDFDGNQYEGTNVGKNIVIDVTFEVKKYRIDVIEPDNGEIKVSNTKISHGSGLKITVTPADGYELDKLYVNGEEVVVEDYEYYVDSVTENIEVEATFKKIETSGCKSMSTLGLVSMMLVLCGVVVLLRKKETTK